MLHDLISTLALRTQQCGVILLIVGCFFIAAGIFSGRIGHFVKGGGLLVAGGYIVSLAGSFH